MKKKSKWNLFSKIILLLVFIVLLIAIVLYTYGGSKITNNLVQASKDYYAADVNLLPAAIGECNSVNLEYLLDNDFIKNEKLLRSCNEKSTYVKVCKLESGNYHYTPIIKCNSREDTEFKDWKVGNESNLVENESDVRFSYLAQIYSTKEKQYYPNNETKSSDVEEYYIASPNGEYTFSDNKTTASKWYIEESGNTYWNNGEYSSTQPNGYPSRGAEGKSVSSISLTKPSEASYRTIQEIVLYRKNTITKPTVMYYVCYDLKYMGEIHSNIPCESRIENNYNHTVYVEYTCDGKETVGKNTKCNTVTSDWTTNKCISSDTVECETRKGYRYVDKRWQWFTTGTYRKYYPSGSNVSSGESTYYVNSPVKGAVEDKTTTTTVQKYYKLVENNFNEEKKWVNLSDDYLNEEELLTLFLKTGYNVKTLSDILKENEIRYAVKLEYSDRK